MSDRDMMRAAAIEAIHSSPTQAVLYISGGASQVLSPSVFIDFWLLSPPLPNCA